MYSLYYFLPTGLPRPNVIKDTKDEYYHTQFARFCLSMTNYNGLHARWMEKIVTNKRFYKGDQWFNQEDIDTFLKDSDNNDRNRLSLVLNTIRPMVEQYRGNAIRMNINYQAKSVSPQSVSRVDTSLARTLLLSEQANNPENPFGDRMKKEFPIGNSEGETRAIHDNTYVDHLVESINYLCKYVSERNKFADKQFPLAQNLAFSGLGVMYNFEYAGHQEFRIVPSETYFWDRSAKEFDFSDATFMGDVQEMFPTEIFEMYQDLDAQDREAIENFSRYFSTGSGNIPSGAIANTYIPNGKVPVYRVYWRDGQQYEFGYVKDAFGYEYLARINYTYPGETSPRYTDENLIQVNSVKARKLLGGKLKRKIFVDELRMAIIIPREILASVLNDKEESKAKLRDVVLDWGLAPYQETETLEFNSVKFPYKAFAWAYVDGEVLSPLDDAIDPQRFINRVWSVAENQLNNSNGTGIIIDRDALEDEAEAEIAMKASKPILVSSKGRGVQNVVGSYGGERNMSSAIAAYNMIDAMKMSIKEMTGVNDALQGGSVGNGNDQLVGVTELMIQRGSLMQEPFYYALTNVFEQCYNSICSTGKRIYADSQRRIALAVGDTAAKIITISKELKLEDFRIFVKRENSDDVLRNSANQMLMAFKQLGMLSDARIANLWDRSTPDQVAMALREQAKENIEMQRMGEQKAQQDQQQIMAQQQGMQQQQMNMIREQQAREDVKFMADKRAEIKKEALKAVSKLTPNNPAANKLVLDTAKNLQNQNL